jgi:hypothetical protein
MRARAEIIVIIMSEEKKQKSDSSSRFVVYPRARLLACKGLLLRYEEPASIDRDGGSDHHVMVLRPVAAIGRMFLAIMSEEGVWRLAAAVESVGLQRVRRLQRWWRLQLWRPRALAVMMGAHRRLGGAQSPLAALDDDTLLQLCLMSARP